MRWSEACLELCRILAVEFFAKLYRDTVNDFRKKVIVDIRLGSKYICEIK